MIPNCYYYPPPRMQKYEVQTIFSYERNQIKDITFLAGQRLCNYFFVRLKCVLSSTHSWINTRMTNFTSLFLYNWFTKTERLNIFQFKNILFRLCVRYKNILHWLENLFPIHSNIFFICLMCEDMYLPYVFYTCYIAR